MIEADVVLAPSAGDVIAIVGTLPRLTVIGPAAPLPKALEQATEIEFDPVFKPTELVVVLVEAAPLTVQVVPAGIEPAPLTVKVVLTELDVVLVLLAGAVITTIGAVP